MIIKEPCIVDISHWERVDWANLDKRVKGVITKATQGKSYIDPTCGTYYAGARGKGLPCGLYHFFEPHDIAAQIDNFINTCKNIGALKDGIWLSDDPILDMEYDPGQLGVHGEQLQAQVKAWLDGVEAATKIKPPIYTSKRFWKYLLTNLLWTKYYENGQEKWDWFPTSRSQPPAWTKDYRLWVAQYPLPDYVDGQIAPAYLPDGWDSWWMWQYSPSGQLAGIAEYTDVNIKNGEYIPPEPPIGGDMYQGTVIVGQSTPTVNSLNIRNAPVTGAIVGGLKYLDKVEADRIQMVNGVGWWHLTKIRGIATTGENWASEGATKQYIRTDSIITPPITETVTVTVEHEGKTGTAVINLQ